MALRESPVARETTEIPPHPIATASLAATSRRDRSLSSLATSSNLRLIPASSFMPHSLSHITSLISFCDRYFLTTPKRRRGSVNDGIYDTLSERPDRFLAYNNGITMICYAACTFEGGCCL